MISFRGFVVLAFFAGSVCASVTDSRRSLSTQQLRAPQLAPSRSSDPPLASLEDGTELGEDLPLPLWASEVLRHLPVPLAARQLVARLRVEQGAVAESAQQQLWWAFVHWLLYVLWALLFLGLWIALFVVVGHFYTKNKQYSDVEESLATPEQQASFKDWKFSFCSCLEDCEVCCCAWWCPCIRWGETLSLVDGLVVFWVGFGIYLGLTMLSWLTYIPLCWLLLTVICAAYRQELRIKFEMRKVGGMTYITDCLLYAFCACCAMSQEARHVEEAFKYGHKAVRVPERQ